MRKAVVALGAALVCVPPLFAGDTYPGTEYISGKAGFAQKIKGTLTIEPEEVRFADKNGTTVFNIPMAAIKKASNSTEKDEGSFGRKAALGIFASKTEEFLQVDTETAEGAEAVVFKTKKKTSPGMSAKINFHVEKRRKDEPPPEPPKQ